MVLEIERKFLLNNGFMQIALMLEGVEFKKVNILQFYTKIAPNYEVRFRKTANEFIKTIKIGKGLIRQENETVISEKEFQKQRKNSIANQISKSRYIFKLNNFPCNIDIYNDCLSDLAIFEIEFMKKSDADVFVLPEFLKNYINKEITFDERYKNKNLALFGLPDFKFNYKKTVKMVEKLNHIKLFFGKNISSYD
ncbi:CYTH domain-containing protein, partial [Campylobacter fetus]